MEGKALRLIARLVDVEEYLGKPDAFQDKKRYFELTQEHAYLSGIKEMWGKFRQCKKELLDDKELLKDETDEEFLEVLRDEIKQLEERENVLRKGIETLLVPPDPHDNFNTILELRAGTGGDEAAIFVGDCVRMYMLFADHQGWAYEHLSSTSSEAGGYREYVMVLSGKGVHRQLQYEGGTHRVQRVPETEAQGRIHTSAVTVAVLLEPDEEEEVILDEKDLRVDTYRASGAGGQHVNVTDSAVRITYVPTGIVSYCSEEKSQHKNKEKAMRLLKAKIAEAERQKQHKEIADKRAQQVGSGDRSERIRTYNFPQNRITDHRINMTKYSLDRFMDGDLSDIIDALVSHFYQKKFNEDD